MPFGYPVMLEVKGRRCVVVGGGSIAEGKVLGLLEAGASVLVIAPVVTGKLEELAGSGSIDLLRRPYQDGDLQTALLAVAATDNPDTNARIYAEGNAAKVLINSVDDIEHCHFAAPSVVRRGDLIITVSTGGKSPALAKKLRGQLSTQFSEDYAVLLDLLGRVRSEALAVRKVDFGEWARRWDTAMRRDLLGLVRQGRLEEARDRLWEDLNDPDPAGAGRVAIVGAGPGDPGLMTVRAKQELDEADVVVYDRLVDPSVFEGKEAIYAGKSPGSHSLPQSEINELLIRLAGEGKTVVRLKGGDPFVFGRGGEEAEALAAAGIEYSVVPAPTSAIAALAAAGIPVTDRRFSSSVTIVTGHGDDARSNAERCSPETGNAERCSLETGNAERCSLGTVDWAATARGAQTLVILMGIKNLTGIVRQLMAGGLPPETPAAIVENGTLPSQRVIVSELATLPQKALEENIHSPAVIVVGEVVKMRQLLHNAREKRGVHER